MGFLDILTTASSVFGGGVVAADDSRETADRVMGGVGATSKLLGAAGSALAPGLSATATSGFGAMGAMEVSAIPGLAAELGATSGAAAGAGAIAVPLAGILGSATAGYGAGRLLDEGVGKISQIAGGKGLTLSDHLAGVEKSSGTRGAGKTFGDMDETERTLAAVFNSGMRPEVRQEILAQRGHDLYELFGGVY